MVTNIDHRENLALAFCVLDNAQGSLPPFSSSWTRIEQQRVCASVLRRYVRACEDHDVAASLGGLINWLGASDQ